MAGVGDGGSPYPLTLHLSGRPVLVVGAGRVAARRVPALLGAGAEVAVVAPRVDAEIDRLAAAGRLRVIRREYADRDLAGVWLVHACTDRAEVNAAVAAAAQQRRVWCVRADDAARSPAWTPATGTAAGVTVAVNAGGDPARAAAIRDAVVTGLTDGSLDAPPGRGRVGQDRAGRGRVVLVGGGPGAPDLITVRGRRLLFQADVVVTDRLGPRELLAALRSEVEIVDVGKVPGGPATRQDDINRLLVERARAGQFVVRLKGGDPFVLGRGGEELAACAAAGVDCEVVPGLSSALAGPALAGIPLTHRGVAQEFVVASGHLPPGDPGSTVDWRRLGGSQATVVILMGTETVGPVVRELIAGGRRPDTPAAVIEAASTPAERLHLDSLQRLPERLAEQAVRPPAVIVVGEVVRLASILRKST